MLDAVTHNTLKHLVEAGSVRAATAIAQGDHWSLVVKLGLVEKTVIAKNSGQVKQWRHLDTLARYITQLGIHKFETDATHYDPDQKTVSRSRPDAAAALKKTHEDAAHNQWFREQVAQAVKQADDPATKWLSNDEVIAIGSKKRTAWRAGAKG